MTLSSLQYTSSDGGTSYVIGHTRSDYLKGAAMPSEVFAAYLSKGGSLDDYEGMVEYATVTTEDRRIALNLREQPNTNSAILAELPFGTQVRVRIHSAGWSMVEVDGQTGYLMNQYLDFWKAPENLLDTGSTEQTDEAEAEDADARVAAIDTQYALVKPRKGSKASVYKEDSIDAKVLGSLKKGTKLKVLESVDGWNRISYKGHTGYMVDEDLKFIVQS